MIAPEPRRIPLAKAPLGEKADHRHPNRLAKPRPSRPCRDKAPPGHPSGTEKDPALRGRIAKEKNLSVLFEMAAVAFEKDPLLRLWLHEGDGPTGRPANRWPEIWVLEIVSTLRAPLIRDEVDRYYAAADLFVFSSLTETQGLVVQEAMTHGITAIAVAGGRACGNPKGCKRVYCKERC